MPEDHTFASTVRGGVSRDNESVLKMIFWHITRIGDEAI
jgi:hypothetical protein